METERLLLRPFEERDLPALFLLLKDEEVNTFLPWFPARSLGEAKAFYEERLAEKPHAYAVCLKETDEAVGYVKVSEDDSHDLGYALRREVWGRGIASEAAGALVERLKREGLPYVTATHDRENPRSGAVMRRIGMTYRYSYEEQWQPKDFPVIFRMYQLNLDGRHGRVYWKYWQRAPRRLIETDVGSSK